MLSKPEVLSLKNNNKTKTKLSFSGGDHVPSPGIAHYLHGR